MPAGTSAAPGSKAGTQTGGQAFDIEKVPMSTATLPPFPYLAYPPAVGEGVQFTDKADFDVLYVLTGKQLRKVEGRVESHKFSLLDAKMSEAEARHNYENLIAAMGGVKVNDVQPLDLAPAFDDETRAVTQKLRYTEYNMSYAAYVVRKPDQLVWIVLMSDKNSMNTLSIAEQPFKQTVAFVTADAMQSALASAGHVALYINFDTDKASIRSDGKPAVDEIAKLLQQDPTLKLTIEGHTDNVGDAAHNKALSQQRADAVLGALLAAGIAKERLTAVGLGDARPVADNKDEAGRARNRRVELVKRT